MVTLHPVFLGDDAFALKRFMMKPFPQQGLTREKRVYNYRHSKARRISENLFEILANRWRVFFTIINLKTKYVKDVVLTALILSQGKKNFCFHLTGYQNNISPRRPQKNFIFIFFS